MITPRNIRIVYITKTPKKAECVTYMMQFTLCMNYQFILSDFSTLSISASGTPSSSA